MFANRQGQFLAGLEVCSCSSVVGRDDVTDDVDADGRSQSIAAAGRLHQGYRCLERGVRSLRL
jgi:hypothetical protein